MIHLKILNPLVVTPPNPLPHSIPLLKFPAMSRVEVKSTHMRMRNLAKCQASRCITVIKYSQRSLHHSQNEVQSKR